VLRVTGDGTDTTITDVVFPRQQSLVADIHRLFPAALRDKVTVGNIRVRPGEEELRAQAEQALSGRVTYLVPDRPGT
jgi:hypothetical protein